MNRFDRLSLALVAAAFVVLSSPVPATEAPDVTELMTPEEFRASGLEKLSAEELAVLNRWLVRFAAKDARQLREHSEAVREEIKRVDDESLRTRIVGEFRGWDGETVFRLENGQTWKQRLRGRWFYRATSPEVELRKNFLGYWEMRIVEADRAIGVTRID